MRPFFIFLGVLVSVSSGVVWLLGQIHELFTGDAMDAAEFTAGLWQAALPIMVIALIFLAVRNQ